MNKNKKFKEELLNKVIVALANTEKHCSYDGDNILITGNTKKLDKDGFAYSAIISTDEFLWLKLVRGVYNLSLDHSNGYKGTVDKNGKTWKVKPACLGYDEEGKQHHYFLSSVLKEYPGKGNWSYNFYRE